MAICAAGGAISQEDCSGFPHTDADAAPGAALFDADQAVREAPPCRARSMDVAGDGIGNIGLTPAAVYG